MIRITRPLLATRTKPLANVALRYKSDQGKGGNSDNSTLSEFTPTVETLYEMNKNFRDENCNININKKTIQKRPCDIPDEEILRVDRSNTARRQFLLDNGFLSSTTDINNKNPAIDGNKKSDNDTQPNDKDPVPEEKKDPPEGSLETTYLAHMKYIKEKMRNMPTPKQLKAYLDKFIVGQEKCKKIMSVAVYNHYVRINDSLIRHLTTQHEFEIERKKKMKHKMLLGAPLVDDAINEESKFSLEADHLMEHDDDLPDLEKSNIMLLGPSGSGKTLIAKTLAKVLKVPIVIQDCTSLTQAGYVGEDIESCVEKLLIKSDYDVDLCERGIIVLDEIDKLSKPSVFSGTKDIAGEGVQQGLLKLIEGSNVTLQLKKQGSNSRQATSGNQGKESYTIDTSNILFITMGAFVGLDKLVTRRLGKVAEQNTNKANQIDLIKLDEESDELVSSLEFVTSEDLTKFGLIPEFIGRIPIIATLDQLNTENLASILTDPKNSIMRQYEYFFEKSGVKLAVTSPAIQKIAELSLKNGTGARGLRSIMEKLLLAANYDCPGSGISYVLVDNEVIDNFIDKIGRSSLHDFQVKYYSRADVFKFLTDIGAEDEELMSRTRIESNVPKSLKLDIKHKVDENDKKGTREFI
ncbi:unnamed protein product [Ambrosiozyma monospora]|uniref:Unnamed protein product n=1 Tax=Ambrosiozyma monospora TaxID=43982 RepID=A0ACB5SRP5_AMBMO|nr:unnamed protein product [Ambrosiozyma monospora]